MTPSRILVTIALMPLVPATAITAELPVINPVPKDADLIQPVPEPLPTDHVRLELNESFPHIAQRSTLALKRLDWDHIEYWGRIDITYPARFSYTAPDIGFTIPAALRIKLSPRRETFAGKRQLPESLEEMRIGIAFVRKFPVYSDPKAVLEELNGWDKRLKALGYERVHREHYETRQEFLAKAHKQYNARIGSEYPGYQMRGWRRGNIGIELEVQRSPHPSKEGPKAHGYNIGVMILDLRVKEIPDFTDDE
jgi:hypothetical protein